MPRMLQALRDRGADQDVDRDEVQWRKGPGGLTGTPAAGNSADHHHPGSVVAVVSGIGPLAVVGFAVLAVALLTATLGHRLQPPLIARRNGRPAPVGLSHSLSRDARCGGSGPSEARVPRSRPLLWFDIHEPDGSLMTSMRKWPKRVG